MALFEFDLDVAVEKKVSAKPETHYVKREKRPVTYEELVHINRELPIEGYSDFTQERYPYGLVFYDFEVFMYDWLVVLIDPVNKTKTIICNNRSALQEYYDKHNKMIWVGYNNKHYDVPILKGILLGHDPKEISDKLIIEGKKPYEMSREYGFNRIELISYDVMVKKEPPESLKLLEGYMGNDIEETEVDFNLDRPLTREEMGKTMKYCIHDVEQTIEVFIRRIDDFNANVSLVETFDLPFNYVSKTKGQLTAIIVGCERQEHDDEFDIRLVPYIQLDKYKYVQQWFVEMCKQHSYGIPLDEKKYPEIFKYGKQVLKKDSKTGKQVVSFETKVCGVPHVFAWGGVHGCPDEPVHTKGKMFHADVTSFYPSEMIEYEFLTRNCKDKEKFKQVYDTRVALKKAGKKKEQAPYKIILNSQYGITKDRNSDAYDPVQANNICINGQLLLLDLLEKLEFRMKDRFQLLQSNTDGIIVKLDEDPMSEKMFRHICDLWINQTKMGLGIDGLTEYVAKDVNNYVFKFDNGKLELKGKYVKENSDLDNNLPILNEAMVKFIVDGIPVEDTINNCNEMIKFQSIYRLSGSTKYAWHNGEYLSNKTYRVYASKDDKDTYLGKSAGIGMKVDKFQDTPKHCFILNQSVKDIPMSIKLDKTWYIDMAKKRLEQYGYVMQTGSKLF